MTCPDWQMKIAAEMEDPSLDEHVSGCEACREFARDLADNAAALRSIEIDPAAYTAVRARVLEAVRPKLRFAWLWAAAAAVAACAVLVWFAAPLRAPVTPLPALTRAVETPGLLPPVLPVERAKIRRPRPRPLIAQTAEKEPLTAIKLLTDDPNVVIIWLVDRKGDSF